MSRLIDADHLKKWMLARWQERNPQTDRPFKAIEILDQIDREMTFEEPHWITCSEKLPDKMLSTYLVTDNEGDVYICGWASGKWVGAPREIIAWMLLPEPYKEGNAG